MIGYAIRSSGRVILPDFSPMTLLEETAESVEITYTYDALNRLTAADYDTGAYFHYEYDAVGNRLEEAKKLDPLQQEVVTASAYTNNKLSSITTASGTVNLTWDNNGNLLSVGEKTYTYNHANQLTSFTVGDDVYEFTYNGLGNRVSQTKNGVTTDYALDQVAGLTQVLEESAPQGYESYTYLYGNGRIGQFTAQDSEYYLTDALGSVRQMVDGSGEITLTKSYEPYGKVISSLGNGSSAYGYTGEMQDASTGMVYLRARYYASYLNQFIQPDPILHDPRVPADVNRYSYGRNNPLRYVDPSGMISCEDSNDPECVARATRLNLDAAEIKEKVKSGSMLPVEGLATLVSKAMELFDHDIRGMMWSTTVVLDGFDPNQDAVWKQAWKPKKYGEGLSPFFIEQDWLPYRNDPSKDDKDWGHTGTTWTHSLRGDWRKDYWDKTANQAYHFWFSVSVQFFDRGPWSLAANIEHDNPLKWEDYDYINSPDDEAPPISMISKPDFMLSLAGMSFGARLTQEYELLNLLYPPDCRGDFVPVTAFDPGSWIRSNLK